MKIAKFSVDETIKSCGPIEIEVPEDLSKEDLDIALNNAGMNSNNYSGFFGSLLVETGGTIRSYPEKQRLLSILNVSLEDAEA